MDTSLIQQRLSEAYTLATRSPDRSNQNGAVIASGSTTLSTGFNHFYPGVPPTNERPAKYERIVHAEADACLRLSVCTSSVDEDTTMFCPWATCKACAIAILGSRIPTLVIHKQRCEAFIRTRPGQDESALQEWQPDIDESNRWLRDGGCEIIVFSEKITSYVGPGININGRLWDPSTLEFV